MTLQEAIPILKRLLKWTNGYQNALMISEMKGISESLETIISAYEITDEQIEMKANEYSECEDANRKRYIDADQFDAYVQGVNDFRDGKISKS